MLHFKIFSLDGIVGLSPLEYQAETMGLAKAGQQWSARFTRRDEGQAGVVWRDNCWALGHQLINQVRDGQREVPTDAELLSMLPALEWPAPEPG